MKKGVVILALLALLSKLIGFVKEAMIAYYFGTSCIVDAFTMADSIVVLLSGWIVALATVYIPTYIQIRKDDGLEEADRFTNSLINIALKISVLFIAIVVIFRKQITYLFASSASLEMRHWLEIFLVAAMISTLSVVIYRIIRANMDSREKYVVGGIADTFISIAMLCNVFMAGIIRIELLALSSIIGYGIGAVICIGFVIRSGQKISLFEKIHPAVIIAIKSAVPILLNSLIVDVMSMTDKVFGATLPEGTIAMLTYASMLESAVFQIVGTPILTVVYPNIAESVLEKDKRPFRAIFERSIKSIFIIFVPITIAVIMLSANIIGVIYQRGNFDSNAAYHTSILLRIYICGAVVAVLNGLMSRFLISINFAKTVLYTGILSAVLNIALNAVFINPLGANGLALASVVATAASIPIYLWKGREWIGKENYNNIIHTIIKCIVAAAFMTGYVLLVRISIGKFGFGMLTTNLLILVVSAMGGTLIYFLFLYVMRVDEVRITFKGVKNRLISRRNRR